MSVRTTTTLLNAFLALASLGLSQAGQQPLPTRTAAVESSNDSLPKAFQRIQVELKQIAEDIATVDARMSQQSRNAGDPTVSTASRIRELLKNDDPAMLIRDFLDATQNRLLFESCLKSGKLYRNLAAEIFRTPLPEAGQATGKSTLGDSFAQVAQLFFLSRMIPEWELQYGEFQSRDKGGSRCQAGGTLAKAAGSTPS